MYSRVVIVFHLDSLLLNVTLELYVVYNHTLIAFLLFFDRSVQFLPHNIQATN